MEHWAVSQQDNFIFVIFSFLQFGLFQLLRCDDNLMENLFMVLLFCILFMAYHKCQISKFREGQGPACLPLRRPWPLLSCR